MKGADTPELTRGATALQPRIAASPGYSRDRSARPRAAGKFLHLGEEKLWLRGVTYGPFRPDADDRAYPARRLLERDLGDIAAHGFNAIRTYTVPPPDLLDEAARCGLRVMVGVPWEQHVTFLDDRSRGRAIERRVRDGVRACARHPAVLGVAIGNEIPAPIVRWSGRQRVERFLERLYEIAKGEDPHALVTYVNYPTTEYLDLPFLDFVTFNVYLEAPAALQAYLARLQNLAGDRPLVMGEIGLDSRRHSVFTQAHVLDWQVRTAFAEGCAGAFVFAWTDAWHRGGYDIDDWDFGLTTRGRRPKPALRAVARALAEVPVPRPGPWPRISVVVCSYNGARTIRECLDALARLDYPDYEVIVVDDGSTDLTAAIARSFDVRVISTPNQGLSRARNTGLAAATGAIVAYIDDDAYPDPHWLTYLSLAFRADDYAAVGGPNIPPPDDGPIARCVAHAPGGPAHVLLADREAEHIPGCNMAFRRDRLAAIGGFDPRFRTAGDDVDVCWRLQERGWRLGFSAPAMVWHHRRNSVRAYWRQQRGYGRAEALLQEKWPEKYNGSGHLTWAGRVYGGGLARLVGFRPGRVYHGTWGSALFQSLYGPAPSAVLAVTAMPEWYLVVAALAALSLLGLAWAPLLAALPLLALAVTAPLVQAWVSAVPVTRHPRPRSRRERAALRLLTLALHLLQPLARLTGRLSVPVTPPAPHARWPFVPRPRTLVGWSETWCAPETRLARLEAALRASGARVRRGGAWDRWDLEVRGGRLARARARMVVEEHGAGRQLARLRFWPRCSRFLLAATAGLGALAAAAALDGAFLASAVLSLGALTLAREAWRGAAAATAALAAAWRRSAEEPE